MFDVMFTLMAKSDNEEDKEKVTLFDIKQNFNAYSIKKMRKLDVVLLDLIS